MDIWGCILIGLLCIAKLAPVSLDLKHILQKDFDMQNIHFRKKNLPHKSHEYKEIKQIISKNEDYIFLSGLFF